MGIEEIRKLKEQAAVPKQKKIYNIPKQSEKKKAQIKLARLSGDSKQDLWFIDKRKEMSGKCLLCGSPTEKNNDETYRRSIAHLLAKRKNMFPSVATHPDIAIELCYYYNSCHTNFDNGIITLQYIKSGYPKAWAVIIEKFKKVYPSIAPEEVKRLPDILLLEL